LHRYQQLSQRSTRTALYCRSILLVFVRSCSSINNKIISLNKNLFHHSQLGVPQKEKNPGALGTCPVCPLVKTALPTSDNVGAKRERLTWRLCTTWGTRKARSDRRLTRARPHAPLHATQRNTHVLSSSSSFLACTTRSAQRHT